MGAFKTQEIILKKDINQRIIDAEAELESGRKKIAQLNKGISRLNRTVIGSVSAQVMQWKRARLCLKDRQTTLKLLISRLTTQQRKSA